MKLSSARGITLLPSLDDTCGNGGSKLCAWNDWVKRCYGLTVVSRIHSE